VPEEGRFHPRAVDSPSLLDAVVLLVVAREWTEGVLDRARGWLVLDAWTIGAVLVIALAASLLRGGIAGLTT